MKLNFPGVPIYLNGCNYFVPSLSTRQYRENQTVLETDFATREGESAVAYSNRLAETILPVALKAINRNYPDITLANLEDWVGGIYVLLELWKAVQGASGMQAVTEGEAPPATATEPTGTGSTGA